MRRTTTEVVLAAAILALAGCSSSKPGSDTPAKPSPAASSSAPAAAPAEDQLAACTDAIAAGKDSSAPQCADLSPDDYFKALQAANKQGRGALESALESATAQP